MKGDAREALKRYWEAIDPPEEVLANVRERLLARLAVPPPKPWWARAYPWLAGVALVGASAAWFAGSVEPRRTDMMHVDMMHASAPATPSWPASEDRASPRVESPLPAGPPSVNVRDLPTARPSAAPHVATRSTRATAATATPAMTRPAADPAASPAPGLPSLAEELAAIDRARAALRAGDGRRASEIIEDYERRWPRARFEEEAAAIRVEALAVQGAHDAAKSARASFLARWPGSTYAPRLERLALP